MAPLSPSLKAVRYGYGIRGWREGKGYNHYNYWLLSPRDPHLNTVTCSLRFQLKGASFTSLVMLAFTVLKWRYAFLTWHQQKWIMRDFGTDIRNIWEPYDAWQLRHVLKFQHICAYLQWIKINVKNALILFFFNDLMSRHNRCTVCCLLRGCPAYYISLISDLVQTHTRRQVNCLILTCLHFIRLSTLHLLHYYNEFPFHNKCSH